MNPEVFLNQILVRESVNKPENAHVVQTVNGRIK